jgi:hypothetical protein
MSESRQHVVDVLRRAGLAELAAQAQLTLSDPLEQPELDRFCRDNDLSAQSLMERLGAGP